MKKIKWFIVTLVMMCGILMLQIPTLAAEVSNSTTISNKDGIQAGEVIEITVGLDNYSQIEKGINALKAILEYDKNLFQEVQQVDFSTLNSWEELYYNPSTQEFVAIKKQGSKSAEQVAKIIVQAKENVTAGQAVIRIKDIAVSEGTKDLFTQSSQVLLNVQAQTVGEQGSQGNFTISNDMHVMETAPTTVNPMTGDKLGGIIAISITAAIACGLIIFIGFYLRKKGFGKGSKAMLGIAIVGVISAVAVNTAYAMGGKGELNGDGKVDYSDVVLLEKHLISLQALPEDKLSAADMNSDGVLTVTDLSLLIQEVENTLDYTVSLTSTTQNFYPNKNEEIQLRFQAEVSNDGEIAGVIINGEEYQPERVPNSSEYVVTVHAPNAAGIQEYHFTKVRLHNNREIDVDFTEQVDVLKTAPSVENFRTEELTDSAQMKVTFDIKDDDSSITASEMEILKNSDSGLEVVDTKSIQAGTNEFILDLQDGIPYTLNIYLNYNLDSDLLTDHEEDHSEHVTISKEVQLNLDYQFTFGNLKVYDETYQETTVFGKNESIVLSFDSTNATQFKPVSVKVNGAVYSLVEKEGAFSVTIDGFDTTGIHNLLIEEVILENGKVFTPEQDNTVSVSIEKEKPQVNLVQIEEHAGTSSIFVSFNIQDPDQALSNKKVIVRDDAGNVIAEKAFDSDSFQEELSIPDDLSANYVIQVVADYDTSADGSGLQAGKVVYEESITAVPRVKVISHTLEKNYLEKGEPATVLYEIDSNVSQEIHKLIVNNTEVVAEKQSNGAYKVAIPLENTAGKQTLTLSKVIFADNTVAETNITDEVEILKSAPVIENYQAQDDSTLAQIHFTFTVTDPDQAFVSGKVQLIDDAGTVAAEQTIQNTGENTISLPVTEDALYKFRILLSYQKTEDGSQTESDVNVFEQDAVLKRDYNLQISDIAAASEQGTQTVYFEKNNKINVSFTAQTSSVFLAEKVMVNGTEYPLTSLGNNRYQFTVDGFAQAGVQKLTLEKLWMSNSKELEISNDKNIQVEILKDKPQVSNFASEQTDADKLKLTFDLNDPDNALTQAKLIVSDDNSTLLEQVVTAGAQQEVLVDLTTNENYNVSVIADYDRDTNTLDQNSNQTSNEEIFQQAVTASKDVIEFKDVTGARLYHREADGSVKEVELLDITGGIPQNVDDYYAVIEMENLPEFYAGIQSFRQDTATGKLLGVIDQADLVQYSQDGTVRKNEFTFEIGYKDQQGEHALIKDASEFFTQVSQNLSGNFELQEDLDASKIPAGKAAAIMGNFSGTIDGNGHKILNLNLPLFQTVNGGTIKNLVIEDAYITSNSKGILSASIQNRATVENTYIVNSSLLTSTNGLGAFAGELVNNSIIKTSAAINVTIHGSDTIGGIIGNTKSRSSIENCYVTGTLKGTSTHTSLGSRVGGITGWHGGDTISHCFTKVDIVSPSKLGNGGIIGGPQQTVLIDHSLSMSTGTAYRIAGFDTLNSAKEVYEYALSNSTTNINDVNNDGVKEISDVYDPVFFADTLGFDTSIWNLDLVEYGKLPSLNTELEYNIEENFREIPNYSQVKNNPQYRREKEIVYSNMAKIMPFAETNTWVEYGNQIEDTNLLSTNRIDFVLPLDSSNQLVTGIERQNPQTIASIRIVFEDGQNMNLAVQYQKTIGDVVAAYKISSLNLPYQFSHYVSDIDPTLLSELVNLANGYDYAAIAQITPEDESRLYTDYYTDSVKPELESVLTKLIGSQEQYPTYSKSTLVQEQLQKRLKDEEQLKRTLYAYNYYDKWYHIDFGGINLSDLLFFNGSMLAPELSSDYLIGSVVDGAQNLRQTQNTLVFYNDILRKPLGKEMLDFLAGLSKSIAGYNDPSDWFKENFKGILVEQEPYAENKNIEYRIWDIFSHLGDRAKIVLPILTAPQEDMYLISTSSQLVIGSMNRYNEYVAKDGTERQKMETKIRGYSERLGHFYGVSSNWISNSEELLNSFANIQYDTSANFPQSSAADRGEQVKGTTKDPVMKWVYEAIGSWGNNHNGSAAYADGTNVYWTAECALGGDYAFYIFSHETAHNQDGKYFYGGAGRRNGSGPEAHADGNIAQQIEDGSMVFNISTVKDVTADVTNNFSYERINTPEKVHSYYREMFETGYVLEYLQGQAFLQLTPAQQAAVAVQVNGRTDGKSITSDHTKLTESDFAQMNLRTMDDLWNNRIALKAQGSFTSSSYGGYGYETFYDSNWYQQHNDNGTPGSSAFKRLGQEMLGIGGYEDGYMIYISGKSSSDLDALRKITKDPTITWQKYKQQRYANVEKNLSNIPYFDTNEAIKMFKTALEKDVAAANGKRNNSNAVKRTLYGIVKRATNDFTDGTIYQAPTVTSITTAEQLVELANQNSIGNYRLDADIDFSNITPENAYYIANRFIGVLDGNNHKITGLSYPLFSEMIYAEVKDLTIEKPVYQSGSTAILAQKSKNVVVDTVQVKGSDAALPLVANKTGSYYEYGNVNIEVVPTEIRTVDEFLAIGSSDIARTKSYVLMDDLDFSGRQFTASAVPGTFIGHFNGNNHTISNLNAVMFENLTTATIENLGISGGSVTGNSNKGILSNQIRNSVVQKVYLSDVSVTNTTNEVGGLAGNIENSTVKEVSLENINVSADNTVGGIAGQIKNTTVENCLVTGKVKGTLNHGSLGARAGGITGWLHTNSTVKGCYVNVQIESPKAQGSGGIIGGPDSGNVRIENSVSLSTGANAYRIAGFSVLNNCANIYELDTSSSTTNMNTGNTGKVKSVTAEQAKNKNFYVSDLGWSEEVWDFTNIASGSLRLKNAFVTPKTTVNTLADKSKRSVVTNRDTQSQDEELETASEMETSSENETHKTEEIKQEMNSSESDSSQNNQ